MSYANVTCGILTPKDISSQAMAIQIFELLERHRLATPERVGNFEPIQAKYLGARESVGFWKDPFLWKGNKTAGSCEGSIWFGNQSQHSCLYLRISPKKVNQIQLKQFLLETCALLDADFGYVHLTTDSEFDSPAVAYEITHAMDIGLTTHELAKGIPNLPWMTIFGKPYHKIIERLKRRSDLFSVEVQDEPTMAILQLTSSLQDIANSYSEFEMIRQKGKEIIGKEYFYSPNGQHAMIQPDFDFKAP